MPRYDYQCTGCDLRFELVQTFKEAGSGTCPECSGEGRRVFHAVPVIYKGSGFYTTDYGRPKSPASETTESETKESETKEKASSSSSESKSSSESSSSETKSDSTSKAASEATV